MSFEEFQDGRRPSWTSKRNVLAILNLYIAPISPIKFRLNLTYGLGEMSFEELQDGRRGSRLGYRKGTSLVILNLCVTVTLPIKFWRDPTHGLGGDIV